MSVEIDAAVRNTGYRYVTLDLAGLRSGNLNGALRDTDPMTESRIR